MIARLKGILVQKSVTHCVVDVHGTGYRLLVPLGTFYELPAAGGEVVLHVHTHVREDAITLYGFHAEDERDVFELMIQATGIGPRLAVNILSGIPAGEWLRAVAAEDVKRLTAIPGVGRKTAERMVLELKEKAGKLGGVVASDGTAASGGGGQERDDALSALVNLGYKGAAAKEAVERILREAREPLSLDRILKQALRVLAG